MTRASMLASLKPGRHVECNVRGRAFGATLEHRVSDGWRVTPDDARISHYHVTSKQIRSAQREWSPELSQKLG